MCPDEELEVVVVEEVPVEQAKPILDEPEILGVTKPEQIPVGKRRKPPSNGVVAARVAKRLLKIEPRVRAENIQPLNPGFFLLEAMRARAGAKSKAQVRTKHIGK